MADLNNPLVVPCKTLEEDLVLFHYGDLTGTERDALQSHLIGCTCCAAYLRELGNLLPLTVKADEPAQTFWDDYSRELRHKLDATTEKSCGGRISRSSFNLVCCRLPRLPPS